MFTNNDPEIPEGEEVLWMDRQQVAEICPACAERMKTLGIIRVRASVMFRSELAQFVFGDLDSNESESSHQALTETSVSTEYSNDLQ